MAAALTYARQSDTANRKKVSSASADDDDSLSLASQIQAAQEMARREGDEMLEVFSEQFTGFSTMRPEYDRMKSVIMANHGKHPKNSPKRIAKVYVYNYKRLGRGDEGYSLAIELASFGVKVVPVAEQQLGDDFGGKVMRFLQFQFAAKEVTDAIIAANRTRKTRTDAGMLICAGKAIYGYKYDLKTFTRVIEPDEAKIVRRLFEHIAAKKSAYSLIQEFYEEGVLTPRGKVGRWNEKTICRIIRNGSYKGDPMIQYKYRPGEGRYANSKKKIVVEDGVPVGTGTPPIVDDELWDDANEHLAGASRRPRGNAKKDDTWLSGRVYCGNCGRQLVRTVQKSRKNRVRWCCSNYTHHKQCPNCYVPNEEVEPVAWERLLKWVKDRNLIESKLKELEAMMVDPSRRRRLDENNKEIAKLNRQLGNLTDALADTPKGAARTAVLEKMATIEDQIAAHERIGEGYAEDVRQMEEAERHCADLRSQIRKRIDAGTATEGEKAKLAEAVGLTVFAERTADGQRAILFRAFDYQPGRRTALVSVVTPPDHDLSPLVKRALPRVTGKQNQG